MLSRAAMEMLWSLAPCCPKVILEANFRPKSEHERGRLSALHGRKLEVHCHCSPEEAARRFRERATIVRQHPAHTMKMLSAELLEEFDRPFGLYPVIDIDTECPSWIRRRSLCVYPPALARSDGIRMGLCLRPIKKREAPLRFSPPPPFKPFFHLPFTVSAHGRTITLPIIPRLSCSTHLYSKMPGRVNVTRKRVTPAAGWGNQSGSVELLR